jgi:hypothetical protein
MPPFDAQSAGGDRPCCTTRCERHRLGQIVCEELEHRFLEPVHAAGTLLSPLLAFGRFGSPGTA